MKVRNHFASTILSKLRNVFLASILLLLMIPLILSAQERSHFEQATHAWRVVLYPFNQPERKNEECSYQFTSAPQLEVRQNPQYGYREGDALSSEVVLRPADQNTLLFSGITADHQCSEHSGETSSSLLNFTDGTRLVLTGHLFQNGIAADSSVLVVTRIWCGLHGSAEKGEEYLVRKHDLFPGVVASFDEYQMIELPLRIPECCKKGEACRVQMDVRFVGEEMVALHSVTIQDSTASHLTGMKDENLAWRRELVKEMSGITSVAGHPITGSEAPEACGVGFVKYLWNLGWDLHAEQR